MQCKLLVAFVVACFAMTVSAAPVGANEAAIAREPEALNLRLPRIEVAREPEPVVEEAREPKPEPGCTLYTCIWTDNPTPSLPSDQNLRRGCDIISFPLTDTHTLDRFRSGCCRCSS